MRIGLSVGLLAIAVAIFLAKKWVGNNALQRLANACAVVALLVAVLTLVIPASPSTDQNQPQDERFPYSVRIQREGTGQNIPNARVTIEVEGLAPLDEVTDSNGIARFFVGRAYSGKPGRVLVEAIGYQAHRQEIDLAENDLPNTILLKLSP